MNIRAAEMTPTRLIATAIDADEARERARKWILCADPENCPRGVLSGLKELTYALDACGYRVTENLAHAIAGAEKRAQNALENSL